MKKLIALIILFSALSAQTKCYKPEKKGHSSFRSTSEMAQIRNQDIKKIGHSLIDRKTNDRLFLAKIIIDASIEAQDASCQDEGLTPVFQEKLCSGEVNSYIVKSDLCVNSFGTHNNNHLFKDEHEEMFLYPGKMLAWISEVRERLILLPLVLAAEVIVLPLSTTTFVLETELNIEKGIGQKRLKKLNRKNIKINHRNMISALYILLD